MMIPRRYLLLLLMLAMGCGQSRVKLPTASVSGTVTYKGKPLSTGQIVFFHPSGQAAGADIAADGAFTLVAFQGKNRVAIECLDPVQPKAANPREGAPLRRLIPDRYAEPATSGLAFEVKPGTDNKADFALKD